jgi:4-amino-4-deoxy-L-arabinose transferase-like glycosyltransferase
VVLVIVARAALFFILVPYTPVVDNRDSYWQIARNLIDHKGFSDSKDGVAPTNRRPPIPPYFFAGVMWLLGDYTLSIACSNWVVDAVTSILLYLIALEMFHNKQIALTSSLLFAFYAPEMYYSWQALSEPLFGLSLAAFVLFFLRALRSPSMGSFAITGIFLGAASLTRPTMLYYLPVAIVLLVWLLYPRGKEVIKWAAILSFCFILTMIPWVVRNYLVFDEFILTDSNLGTTLYHNTHALSEPDFLRYRTSDEGSASLKKLLQDRLGLAYKSLPQPQLDHIARDEALKIIRQYPGRYLALSVANFFRMWYLIEGPRSSLSYLVLFLHISLLILTAVAFLYYRGEWLQQGILLIVLILYINLGCAVVRTNVRYLVPVVPYLMLFAAMVSVDVLHRIRHVWFG